MKIKLLATTALLSLTVSVSAQITKNQKYDWGWSYKLEMPETGLECEFPEEPTITTLAYGYMTAASFKDELFIAAKLENPNANGIATTTQEFVNELHKVYGLPVSGLVWNKTNTKNGNLTISADSKSGWAQIHVDAIATEDVLTIFLYSHHDDLSMPGHFFAKSYSANDTRKGGFDYAASQKLQKRAKILEYDKGRSVVLMENSPVKLEWPDIPKMEVNRHETSYSLAKNGTIYSARIIELNPEMSYAFFNTYVNREQQKINSTTTLLEDATEVSVQFENNQEAYFRKMIYKTDEGTKHCFYVAADNKIISQELEVSNEMGLAETRFLNTFEQSIRNEYDTKAIVLR